MTMPKRVDRQLNETLDTGKAMGITLEWSSRVCNAQSATMGLLDRESNELRIVSHYGAPDALSEQTTSDLNNPIVQQVVSSQGPVLQRSEDGSKATLMVPVRREGKVIGVITMTATGDMVFPEESVALVSRMADRAAIA